MNTALAPSNVIEVDFSRKSRRSDDLYTKDGRRKARAAMPFKNVSDIHKIRSYFLENNQYRDHMLFVLGINVGRRCGDILKLRVGDVYDYTSGCVKDRFYIIEQKTNKTTKYGIMLNEDAKDAIEIYLASLKAIPSPDSWLFQSRKKQHHISVPRTWQILNDATTALGIDVHTGTHSLRKTFGFAFYNVNDKSDESVQMLQKTFNHSSTKDTMEYLTIEQERIDETVANLGNYYR